MTEGLDMTLTNVTPGAVTDTLLAIEWFADRVYFDRGRNPESAAGWDALAAIVLPLRAALDARSNGQRPIGYAWRDPDDGVVHVLDPADVEILYPDRGAGS